MRHKAALSALIVSIGLVFSASVALADSHEKKAEAAEAKADDKKAEATEAKADDKKAEATEAEATEAKANDKKSEDGKEEAKAGDKKEPSSGDSPSARALMLSYTCAGCHGTGGVSTGPGIPTIAGMAEDTFTASMTAYKEGKGNPTIMGRIAKGYSEDDIKAMATFFSAQKFVAAKQDADADKAKVGAKLHEKYCEKCHEEGGTKDAEGSGILAGQWKPYLQYSLADYIKGDRTATEKKMTKKLEKLHKKEGDDGVTALIEYYASQQ